MGTTATVPEHIDAVFERFLRVARAPARGLGLGLHLYRRLVGAQGGTITVHSAGLGWGSVFAVTRTVASPTAAE